MKKLLHFQYDDRFGRKIDIQPAFLYFGAVEYCRFDHVRFLESVMVVDGTGCQYPATYPGYLLALQVEGYILCIVGIHIGECDMDRAVLIFRP